MPYPIAELLLYLIWLYSLVVFAAVVSSWLIVFRVINTSNPVVRSIIGFLYATTEPVFRQIRRVIPAFGGIDISPLVVLIALWFVGEVVKYLTPEYYLYAR